MVELPSVVISGRATGTNDLNAGAQTRAHNVGARNDNITSV